MNQNSNVDRSNTFFNESFAAPDLFASFPANNPPQADDDMLTTPSTGSTPEEALFDMFEDIRSSVAGRMKKRQEKADTVPDPIHSFESAKTVEKMKTSFTSIRKVVKQTKAKKKKPKYKPTNLVLEEAVSAVTNNIYNPADDQVTYSQVDFEISGAGSFVCQDIRIGAAGITEYPQTQTQSFSQPPLSPTSFSLESPQRPRRDPHVFHTNKDNKTIKFENLVEVKALGTGASSSVTLVKDNGSGGALYARKTVTIGYNFPTKIIVSEVKALYRCRKCPYVIQFFDAFYRDDKIHFILEYMDGNSLEDIMKLVKQVPEDVLRAMTYQVLKGLQYLHNKAIVHRDLKPANVLMKRNGDVKISDFGLTGIYSTRTNPTQLREQQATSAGNYGMKNPMVWKTCQGTILYMSPERIQEQTHSFNSDIWSLGITLAELRLGKYPFKNHSSYFDILEEIKQIEKGQWQLPQDQFSPSFIDFLRQCIVVDPSKRPSAQQLLDHEWIVGIKSKFSDEVHMRQELSKWMQNAINGR